MIITTLIALEKARKYCAYQERSQQEVRIKLRQWQIRNEDAEGIIAKLIEEKFLNEERFAIAFAGGKFRIKKWGRIKIEIELRKKGVSEYCINIALSQINEKDYLKTLKEIILKKENELKKENYLVKKKKIIQFAISKGFESEIVFGIINE